MTTLVRVAEGGTTVVLYGASLVREYVAEGQADVDAAVAAGEASITTTKNAAVTEVNGLVAQAQTARDAAQLAEANAETAETNAETAETNAETFATAAGGHATSAATDAGIAATEADNAEATRAAIQALINGYPGSAGQTIPVATRAAAKAISAPTGSFYLYEEGRRGNFIVVNYADFASLIDEETIGANGEGEGMFFRSTADATKAFMRVDGKLKPRQFGPPDITGTGNSIHALRRFFRMVCLTKLPFECSPEEKYGIDDAIVVGLLDLTVPTAGLIDGISGAGQLNLVKLAAGTSEAGIWLREGAANAKIRFPDIDFDIVTHSPADARMQVRTLNIGGVAFGRITKFGDQTLHNTIWTPSNGSSALSVRNGSKDISFDEIIVEWAGAESSGLFTDATDGVRGKYVRCRGGSEGIDATASYRVCVDDVDAFELNNQGVDLGHEAIDLGNCDFCRFERVHASGGDRGMTIKTETASGGKTNGCNDNYVGLLKVDGYTAFGVLFGQGATTTMTLDRNRIGRLELSSSVATSATVAVRFAQGDVAARPFNIGNRIESFSIDQRDASGAKIGTAFEFVSMIDFYLAHGKAKSAVFSINSAPSAFTTRTNGRIEAVEAEGNLTLAFRGLDIVGLKLRRGIFTYNNPIGCTLERVGLEDCPTDGFNINYNSLSSSLAKKKLNLLHCSVNGCGLTGTGYALKINNSAGGTPAIEDITVDEFQLDDTNRSLAVSSGGTQTPQPGDRLLGNTSGAFGRLAKAPPAGTGTWAAGDWAGTLTVADVSGEFSAAETLTLQRDGETISADVATASGASVAAATSGGYNFSGGIFNYCRLLASELVGVATQLHYGFAGNNSVNDPLNRNRGRVVSTGGNRTLGANDIDRDIIRFTAAATLTLPADATFAWPIGQKVRAVQMGAAGQTVTVAGAAGVTVYGSDLTTNAQYNSLEVEKTAADEWEVRAAA